jgi:anti-sigma factor RsiW
MPDRYTAQLSAYLDDELDVGTRQGVERHLAECPECTELVADLRAIVAAAPYYPGREPSANLWPRIAAGLDATQVIPIGSSRPAVPSPRHTFSWTQLLAASLVMAAVGGGAVWIVVGALRPGPVATQAVHRPEGRPPETRNVAFAEAKYDSAVQDLELLLAAGKGRLDTATVRTIEESLIKIDVAITEARAAIQRDPSNGYLNRQIAANMRRKLNLLRVATNAIAAKT